MPVMFGAVMIQDGVSGEQGGTMKVPGILGKVGNCERTFQRRDIPGVCWQSINERSILSSACILLSNVISDRGTRWPHAFE